jgi:hypothetical protein
LVKQVGKDQFIEWFLNTSQTLNERYWNKIVDAEQATIKLDKASRARIVQSIAADARSEIKRFRTELATFAVLADANAAKSRCDTYLDSWENFFYYMAKYSRTGNIEDFGEASRQYKAVELGLSEINSMLGLPPVEKTEPHFYGEPSQPQPDNSYPVREKEIIREKEVIVKIRCPYCRGTYDETLDECPHCGAKR